MTARTRSSQLLGNASGRLRILFATLLVLPIAAAGPASAHCPLCSAGAGGAAAVASALGIGLAVVGVFVGGFAIATGFWTAKYVDGDYFPYQTPVVAVAVYLAIVLPVLPLMDAHTAVYVSIAGDYGSLLNRTYLLNEYLLGALFGGAVTTATPRLSGLVSALRESTIPYQGVALTFLLLGVTAAAIELLL